MSQKLKKEMNHRYFKQNEITTNEYRSDSISEIRKWKTKKRTFASTNKNMLLQTQICL
jgi:predicted Zn-dependent protease